MIKKPIKSGSSFFNYKQTFSLVLMATVDVDYKFITIDVGSMERFSDGIIFSSSVLAKNLNKRTLQFPPPALLPNFEQPLPYVFVGGEAFPLSNNLMRSYPKISVTGNYKNKVYNYRLSRAAWQPVERTFAILASRFCVFRKPSEIKFDSVVKAGCLLHKYLRNNQILEGNVNDDIEEMPENQSLPCTHTNSRSASCTFIVS